MDRYQIIKKWEGFETNAYPDPATGGDPWTIGYGSTRYKEGSKVRKGDVVTVNQAEKMLHYHVEKKILPVLKKTVPYWSEMKINQRDALTSFAYNLGEHFMNSSGFETISKVLNNKDWKEVPKAFNLYVKGNGVTLPGLVSRRAEEGDLFSKSSNNTITVKALSDTYLKKDTKQSSDLSDKEKVFVPKGKTYRVTYFEDVRENQHDYVTLDYGAGDWYIWSPDWEYPWETNITPEFGVITPNSIDWTDWNAHVSKYFTVGEVSLYQTERIVKKNSHREKVLKVAKFLDEVREERDSPIYVNSWYRPMVVERRIGGSGANHPFGHAVDFRDNGSIYKFQEWFNKTFVKTGRFKSGFGKGANKGFIHIDFRTSYLRVWDY